MAAVRGLPGVCCGGVCIIPTDAAKDHDIFGLLWYAVPVGAADRYVSQNTEAARGGK